MLPWINTLKFKIVALAVATGVLSALATAQLVLTTTHANIKSLLLENDSVDRQNTAALLASKLDTLQVALKAVVRQVKPALWQDEAAMVNFLQDKPALNALFDSVLAVKADGSMLAWLEKGQPMADRPNVADRSYVRNALATDQPVVSEPVVGRVTKLPLVVISMAAPALGDKPLGLIAGSLALRSSGLFSDLFGADLHDGARSIVIDRKGVLLAHPDPARVMGRAVDETGLGKVFTRWSNSGSPINTEGMAEFSEGFLVSMAGIAGSEWALVRLVPQSIALQPILAAQRTGWLSAAGVGGVAALLAGGVAWFLTLPISRLRARAEKLLAQDGPQTEAWPHEPGELGQLAHAFQRVVEQRQWQQGETQALLGQLEAVLEHAEVGIALSRNGHFELVSRQFCHLFHCEKSRVVGQPTKMIFASDEAYQALSARALPAFMAHGVFDGEVELVRQGGGLFWAHLRGRAVARGDRSQGTIWTLEDVTETRAQRERLTWSSSHDVLTRLANRAAFEVLLEQATAQAATDPFCAMFIDLDRFKLVNDTGGHAAGDALLRDVAHQLAAHVRRSDTVARLGGDEFAVLLHRCPLSQARDIAEKLRSAVVTYRLEWEGHNFSVGASIGMVLVDASFATAADVLRAADAACYAAKQQGRNRVVVHGE